MKRGRKVGAAVLTALAAAWLTLFVALMLETTARCCDIPVSRQIEAMLLCGDAAEAEEIRAALKGGGQ